MKKIKVDVYNKGKNELPSYSTELSAGFDIRANLGDKDTKYLGNQKWKVHDDGHIQLFNGGVILIPTGLHVAVPDGYELQVRARSGLALKNSITVMQGVGTVDSDYRGEVGVILINHDQSLYFDIHHGDRIGQGILNQVEQIQWNSVDNIEHLGETERGQGGFGHTGVK